MLLIISQSKKDAASVADTFHYMSILAYAATQHEALSEVSDLYRAALILNPERFADIIDYVKRIKSYKSDLPVFALTTSDPPSYYPDVFDGCFAIPTFTPALARNIIEYANENNRARIGDYYLAGFDASSHNLGVNYFYDNVSFTKTEAMILRFLIRKYPLPTSGKEIVKYAFRSSRAPEASSVKTHISLMNRKLEKEIGKRMFRSVPKKGYIIITPEYEKIVKKGK
jgi:hypothetical protein